MFWLIRKIFSLGIIIAIVFLLMHFQVGGRPMSDYAQALYHSQPVQEALASAKNTLLGYLGNLDKPNVEVDKPASEKMDPIEMDPIKDDERKELEKVINKQNQK